MKLLILLFTMMTFANCTHTSSKKPQGFDAELSQYNYPYPVKTFNFKSQQQDLKMAYMDIPGKGTEKEVFVLLHGKNFPAAYFQQIIESLTSKGFRVIAPDQIGFGKSSKPQNYQFTFQALAANTNALLESLNIKSFKLLGHSMGGMLATRYALMFPETVNQLFLVNPIGLEDWKTMTSYRELNEVYKGELASTPEKIKQYQLDFYYDGNWKADYDKWLEIPTGWLRGSDYPLVAWNSALTADMIFTQPVTYEFKNIKAPTVLIIGQRDRTAIGKAWAPEAMKTKMGLYPQLGRQTQKLIKGSQLEELKGLGHMPFIEDYETFWKAFSKHIN